MALNQAAVALTTARVPVAGGGDDSKAGTHHAIANIGAATAYFGDETMTSADGFPLEPGASWPIDLEGGELLYARTSAGSTELRVISSGQA